MLLTARINFLSVLITCIIVIQLWITYCSVSILRVQLYFNGHIPSFPSDDEIKGIPFYVANSFDMLIFGCGLLLFLFFLYPLLFSSMAYSWEMTRRQSKVQRKIAMMLSLICAGQIVVNILIILYFSNSFSVLFD